MNLRTLLLAVCLVQAAAASAQTPDITTAYRNEITLTVGLHQGYYRDRNFSPLNHTSSGTNFGLAYGRATKNGHRWTGEIAVGLGTLKHPTLEDLPPDRYRVDLSVGYLRRLNRSAEDRKTYAGIRYRSYVDITLYDGSEAITFFGLHALEAAVATDWRTGNRHRLLADVSVPVFGLLARPPYSGWDKFIIDNSENIPKIITRGEWGTFGKFTGVRANIGWAYDLNDRWSAIARYSLAYYATKQLDPVRILDNTFSLSSTLKF